jgi:hypothetical protein
MRRRLQGKTLNSLLTNPKDANATLALELENVQISLAATRDKLDSKSKTLDLQVIRADEAMLRLKNAESRLKAAEEDLKNQRQLLELAQKTTSKRESSLNMMRRWSMMWRYSRLILLV